MGVDLLPLMQGDKAWSPEKWSPRHRLIVALHLGGDRNKEIAEKLSVSENHVSIVLNDPRAVHEIARLSGLMADRVVDTGLRLQLYSNEALDEIVDELRTSRNEVVRQKAAFGILDRAGFTPVRQADSADPPPVLPEAVVERMEATTTEIIQYDGAYKNVDPVERPEQPEVPVEVIAPGDPRGPTSNGEEPKDV